MEEKSKNLTLNILGIFYLALGAASIANSYLINKNIDQIYWFCYFALLLIGLGMLMKNSGLIAVQLHILLIPLLFWSLDFFYVLTFKESLFGITDYFFASHAILGKILSLQHIVTIPISIYSIYLLKLETEGVWKISILEVFLIFLVSRLFTSQENNINCVYKSCLNFIPSSSYYIIIWAVLVTAMIFLSHFFIASLKFLKKK